MGGELPDIEREHPHVGHRVGHRPRAVGSFLVKAAWQTRKTLLP